MRRRTFLSAIIAFLVSVPVLGRFVAPRRIKLAILVYHSDTIDLKSRYDQYYTFNSNPILGMPPDTLLCRRWGFNVLYEGQRRYFEHTIEYEGGKLPTVNGVPIFRSVEHTPPGKLVDQDIEYEV